MIPLLASIIKCEVYLARIVTVLKVHKHVMDLR